MAAPSSEVEICNLALNHLKQAPITDVVTPTTKIEALCNRWYDQTRRSVLRKHPWNFATLRDTIARSGTPEYKYADSYTLPPNFIRALNFGVDGNLTNYEIENNEVLIDNSGAASLKMRYIWDITTVARFDSLFIDSFALQLAIKMAYSFTGTVTLKKDLKEEFVATLSEARAIDGQERPPRRRQNSPLLESRRSRGTGDNSKYITFN